MTVTYSISGGADAGKFNIDATSGALTFKTAPNFEAPGDANTDNIYEVIVKATDAGGLSSTKAMTVTVTDVSEGSPPQITSAGAISVKENQTVVLTVTATDPDEGTQPPATGGPTGGKITNFTNTPNGDFKIDANTYYVHCASNAWCLTKPDDYTLRFENRPGDRRANDGSAVLRSEITSGYDHVADNAAYICEYKFMMESTQVNPSSYFFVIGQQHNSDDDLPWSGGTSPIFALELLVEKMRMAVRYLPPGGSSSSQIKTVYPWTDNANIVRGKWYTIKIEMKSNQSNGYLRMWRDGVQVFNYTGAIGYGCPSYWEYGIYRQADNNVTQVAVYQNMTVSGLVPA